MTVRTLTTTLACGACFVAFATAAQARDANGASEAAPGARAYADEAKAGAGDAQGATAQDGGTPPPASEGDPQAPAADSGNAEIVVTASKRTQKLRDVPSAITVLSSDFLEQQGANTIRDYATLTPGLLVRDQGNPGIGTVIIRGLSTGSGSQSATSVVYFDEIPFGSNSYVAPQPELADIESIEVLKGPQGTLYGASNLGGVVRIISKKADASSFSGNARIEATTIDGGGSGYMARATLNVPIVLDRLAARVSGFYRKVPGFADNVGTNNKNVNDGESVGARIALRWTPTDNLSVDVTGQIQRISADGYAYQANANGTIDPIYGQRQYNMFFDAGSEVKYKTVAVTIDYDVGIGTLTATGSYNKSLSYFDRDTNGPFASLLPLFGYPAGTGLALPTHIDIGKTTGEVRFVSNRLGRIEFLAGAFATRENKDGTVRVNAYDAATMTPVAGDAFLLLRADTIGKYDEVAAFGNATFYFTDNLDVTGGLRYSHIENYNASISGGLLYGAPSLPPRVTDHTDNVVTYLATLRWRPTSRISAFIRAASGFRPGLAQNNPNPPPDAQTSIRPDTVWNYEAGLKGSAFGGKLNFDASVYHIDWKDVQLTGVYNGLVLGANAGKAEVDGAEASVSLLPTEKLTLRGSVGYADARITRISPQATASVGARAGDPLPLNPKWTASLVADQRVPLAADLEAEFGGTLRYESKKFTAYPASRPDVNVRLPSITTVDLRAGLRHGNYHLQFRAENIFDRNGVINSLTTGATLPSNATIIRPRTFILAASAEF